LEVKAQHVPTEARYVSETDKQTPLAHRGFTGRTPCFERVPARAAACWFQGPLPRYVEDELRGYLRCGDFSRGFVFVLCTSVRAMRAIHTSLLPTEPVIAARSAQIEAEGGNPFTQYAVPAAAITLKQGFGRPIRTKKDAGIVALLDRRATKRGYGRALLGRLPPARRVRSVDAVRDFWQSMD
jgi:hypothetical protein